MRQIKRGNNGMGKNKILITCAKGITPFLREELLLLGFPVTSETVAGIETEGTMEDTLRLNLLLRTGHRVLFLLREFSARDADDLYRAASYIEWEDYIDRDEYVNIILDRKSTRLNSSHSSISYAVFC